MAVQIPPWLNIDPIEPARLAAASASRRQQAAIAERAAQLREQEMEQRAALESQRIAAMERAQQRRQLVYEQTKDAELAQQAQALQMRREVHAQQARQFQQQLRLKQQAAERQVEEATTQMEGSRQFQKDLEGGMPVNEAVAKNGPKLFYRKPGPLISALKATTPPAAPQFGTSPGGAEYVTGPGGRVQFSPRARAGALQGPITAQQVLDEQGQPIGMRAIPGAGGGVHMLPRTTLSPEGRVRAVTAQLAVIRAKMSETPKAKRAPLQEKEDQLMAELEALRGGGREAGKVDEGLGMDDEETPTPDEGEPTDLSDEDMMDEEETVPADDEEE